MARIWVDMTNSPHVVIFRPLIAEMERRGHEVVVTARDFAQTVGLLERHGMPYTLIGRHQGRSILNKVIGVWSRGRALADWARTSAGVAARPFDVAVSHGSNDLPLAARMLGIPHVTMFDYEHATLMHHFNVRLSARVIVPAYIPERALSRYGLRPEKLSRYVGLKEEYYLADFEPDETVLRELGLDGAGGKVIVAMRTPPSLAAYHRRSNPLFPAILEYLGGRDDVVQVILPRTPEQRTELLAMGLANAVVPDRAVDAQSLVYFADLVVSAGGTLNREAVALGTPAFTIFEGRMGAVDEELMRQGRLGRVGSPEELPLVKKAPPADRLTREPSVWVDLILAPPVLPRVLR